MYEKSKWLLLVFVLGAIIGSSAGIAITGIGCETTRQRYESTLADWQRQLAERDRELGEARKLAEQRRAMDAEIMGAVEQGLAAVRAARSEYDRAIAQLRLAQSVYETLRKYYNPGVKGQPNPKN